MSVSSARVKCHVSHACQPVTVRLLFEKHKKKTYFMCLMRCDSSLPATWLHICFWISSSKPNGMNPFSKSTFLHRRLGEHKHKHSAARQVETGRQHCGQHKHAPNFSYRRPFTVKGVKTGSPRCRPSFQLASPGSKTANFAPSWP